MPKIKLYGSLNSRLMESANQPTPEVGMGATITMHTDRHACTIVAISEDGKRIETTRDKAIRTDLKPDGSAPMTDCQSYRYETVPDARREVWTLRKDGSWVKDGEPLRNGQRICLGFRSEHYDYSF